MVNFIFLFTNSLPLQGSKNVQFRSIYPNFNFFNLNFFSFFFKFSEKNLPPKNPLLLRNTRGENFLRDISDNRIMTNFIKYSQLRDNVKVINAIIVFYASLYFVTCLAAVSIYEREDEDFLYFDMTVQNEFHESISISLLPFYYEHINTPPSSTRSPENRIYFIEFHLENSIVGKI